MDSSLERGAMQTCTQNASQGIDSSGIVLPFNFLSYSVLNILRDGFSEPSKALDLIRKYSIDLSAKEKFNLINSAMVDNGIPTFKIIELINYIYPSPSQVHCSTHQSTFIRDRQRNMCLDLGREVSIDEAIASYQGALSGKFYLFYFEKYVYPFYADPIVRSETINRGDDRFVENITLRIERMNNEGLIPHKFYHLPELLGTPFPGIMNPSAFSKQKVA